MTGLIPRPFIDELLNRTDIIEFIDSYVPLKKRGSSHTACCPFHNEKSPSFNVVAKKQFYYCFGCGASGNAISFAMNYLHQGFTDAIETLATRIGITVPRENNDVKHTQSLSQYQLLSQVANFYQKQLKSNGKIAIDYLKQRGVNGETAFLYQVGYAPDAWQILEHAFKKNKDDLIATGMLIAKDTGKTYDRYRHRIMFPIHDRNGRIIGFGGRALDNTQKPKYLNSPETIIFQKSRELYGLYQVLKTQKTIDDIIVVEGYLDVIALAQYGINNAVATLGTATSTYHIQLLSKFTKQLFFCFDGDAAGRQAAWRALESSLPHLNSGLDANFIFLPDGHDPDSLVRAEGKEGFIKQVQNAIPLHRFFFDSLVLNVDYSKPAGKTQLINIIKPYFIKIPEGPYKQLLIDELARLTHIESHRVQQLLQQNEKKLEQEKSNGISRSPIRLAIALLLQHPEIYTTYANQLNSVILDGKDQNVLQQLIDQVAKNPQYNTATLIELWRESPLFESMNKLAAWQHQVPEKALAKEFIDTILFLEKQSHENKIQLLLEKSRNQGLNEVDRLTLQNMLKKRHKVIHDEN